MAKTNAQNVAAYYERNKKLVLYRKMMKRCREHGAIPSVASVLEHSIPLAALLVAFGEWTAATTNRYKLKKQVEKLERLKVQLTTTGKNPWFLQEGLLTNIGQEQIDYLKRFHYTTTRSV
jgi:hypothetical protein